MASGPNNPQNETIRKEIKEIQFGFYNDDEVRQRSVVEIKSSQAFDPTNNPLPNGLYDPRMGPLKDSEPPCPTCALQSRNCPGHAGHIELSVPVYHPLLFKELLQCLRIKCYACHELLAPARVLRVLKAKFLLLESHNVNRLQTLDDELAVALTGVSLRGKSDSDAKQLMAGAYDSTLDSIEHAHAVSDTASPPSLNSHEKALRKQLVQEVFSSCKSMKRCSHCNAANPRIRQDSANKIFQAQLSATLKRWNAVENIRLESALSTVEKSGYQSDDDGYGDATMSDGESDDGDDVDSGDSDDDEVAPSKSDKYMHAREVQAQVQRTWAKHVYLLSRVFGNNYSQDDQGWGIFFWQAIPVTPSRFRPAMYLNGAAVEHSQTQYLSQIIRHHEMLREAFIAKDESKAYASWIDLQTTVNCLVDSSKDPSATPSNLVAPGYQQILERKEGLFRKNLMGKRVDYACRSVISPDPYIGTNEIGLPQYFANVLTFPVPVTDRNVREMRRLVERGVEYPGARWVEVRGQRLDLQRMNASRRQAVAAQLLQGKPGERPVIVGRQLIDGDYVLMNRQPTLHKPGIMAHRVRILHSPTQKTIRMHYANCNTYNADFDGDEMNCHFPQNYLGQAEAQYVARTDLQYIAPTDGSPLRGLIQDHVVGGVKLTKRDSFFEKWQYQQLVFSCLASLDGLEVIRSDEEIGLVPPAIMKPRQLWTGKQVITTLLNHLRTAEQSDSGASSRLPGLSCSRKAKTPEAAFGEGSEENLVLIRDGELLRGVLDKAAFGSTDFSLVHAVYEAYGPEKAGLLLNMLGRLFTAYIQYFSGHSCRVEDLVLTSQADKDRRKLVQRAYNMGARAAKAWADSDGGKAKIPSIQDESPLQPFEAATTAAKIGELLSGNEGSANFAALDGFMQGQLNPLSSDIVKQSLPSGLAVSFPHNTFGIMTATGAKGSIVNQSQVTCALGQQALEGRRVPRLSSGRTLPSFAPYDPNPRADGFVMDRFLTGIRPQEYYFHCMAGREGLVDTAVKTSRSGYLQRCLMKHLEELKVEYDYTVRNSEGGVVQFLYGEDGLDPTKAAYLDCTRKSFEFIGRNRAALARSNLALPNSSISDACSDAERNLSITRDSKGLLLPGSLVAARKLRDGADWNRGKLCIGWYHATVKKVHKDGSIDIRYADGTKAKRVPPSVSLGRCGGTVESALSSQAVLFKPATADPLLSRAGSEHTLGRSGVCVSEKVAHAAMSSTQDDMMKEVLPSNLDVDTFCKLVGAKYSSSLCFPGEAVGAVAAQSVGEPSTQMTLNTFHLAGSGANVTLGIPRLREIIMTASRSLKTPTMSVPLNPNVSTKAAIRLTREFSRLPLSELFASHRGVGVTEQLEQSDTGDWVRSYYITLKFHAAERIREAFGLNIHDIAGVVSKNFVPALSRLMKKEMEIASVEADGSSAEVLGGESSEYVRDNGTEKRSNLAIDHDELDDSPEGDEDEDENGEEDGAVGARESSRRKERLSYESDSEASEKSVERNTEREMDVDDTESSEVVMRGKNDTITVDENRNALTLPPLRVDPSARPLLMVDLIEAAASSILVLSKKDIEQGFVNEEEERGRCLQTAGINFAEIYKLDNVDHDRLISNDIWMILCSYGVEAARNSIVDQIRGVFGAYGIDVDPRHLSLIADYMTFEGGYKAMNRIGMEDCSSPLLQMSFETTVHFLKQASLTCSRDSMKSPSANIVVGRPIRHGTGSFAVLAS